jgi:hypothetical protein
MWVYGVRWRANRFLTLSHRLAMSHLTVHWSHARAFARAYKTGAQPQKESEHGYRAYSKNRRKVSGEWCLGSTGEPLNYGTHRHQQRDATVCWQGSHVETDSACVSWNRRGAEWGGPRGA